MKTFQTPFPGNSQEDPDASSEYTSGFAGFLDKLSSIIPESIHVLDIRHRRFCYISPNDLVLCGYSTKDALKDRDGFLQEIVYPADYTLWTEMHTAILQYLKNEEEKQEEIDCFSCTYRLQRRHTFLANPLPQMIFLRIKPDWKDGELCYLIYTAGISTIKEAGNLRMYHKNGSIYKVYDFKSKRWKQNTIEPLTEYEKVILILAGQGYTIVEIARILCKGYNTVCNWRKQIYSKFKVHTIQEAVELAYHHGRIYTIEQERQERLQPAEMSAPPPQSSLTKDRIQRIQQYLYEGKSIRQAAKQEGLAEGTVRYWIKREKLKK